MNLNSNLVELVHFLNENHFSLEIQVIDGLLSFHNFLIYDALTLE